MTDAELIRAAMAASGHTSLDAFARDVLMGRHGPTVGRWLEGAPPMPPRVRERLTAWLAEHEATTR